MICEVTLLCMEESIESIIHVDGHVVKIIPRINLMVTIHSLFNDNCQDITGFDKFAQLQN